jgi:hypothetical protein
MEKAVLVNVVAALIQAAGVGFEVNTGRYDWAAFIAVFAV